MSEFTPKSVIAVGAVLPGLATIAVILRFYGRLFKASTVGVDDWMILCSLILTIGLGVMLIVGSALSGLAQPTPPGNGPEGFLTVINDALIVTEKIEWAFNLVQCLSFGTAKLSVILFYRRIFRGQVFDIISKTMIAIVIAWMLSFFLAILFECGTNYWALWSTLENLLAHCVDDTKIFKAFSISDVITDVLILSMPFYWLWNLHMSWSRKIAVTGIFLLGALAIAAGIARLVIYIQQTTNAFSKPAGIMLITTQLYWSMIEMGLCVIAACLPTLRPLFAEMSAEQIINSIRSKFSMDSVSSLFAGQQRSSKNGSGYNEFSTASETHIVPKTSDENYLGVETHAMKDLEGQAPVPSGRIMKHTDISSRQSAKEQQF